MPSTALGHFNEDLDRARAIVNLAQPMPVATAEQSLLRSDLLRSGWMFAVGALDAYFCDAYTDVIAACLIAKSNQGAVSTPSFLDEIKIPVSAVIESYNLRDNWKWRMAARRMMRHDHLYDLSKIQKLFNKFCRKDEGFYKSNLMDTWLQRTGVTSRLMGVQRAAYLAMTPADKRKQQGDSRDAMLVRMKTIVQRRHDCIHNCDRPSNSPQTLDRPGTVRNVIKDIKFVVHGCDSHINSEFKVFLSGLGFSAATIQAVGY
ncbi:hypothetical protein OAG68_00080 [bacterium]|nr:hypothetical protein [bacterium]